MTMRIALPDSIHRSTHLYSQPATPYTIPAKYAPSIILIDIGSDDICCS